VPPKEPNEPPEVTMLNRLGLPVTLENIAQLKQAQTVTSQEPKDPLIRQYEYAQKQGFKGSLFDYKRLIAEAGRPPAAGGGGGGAGGKTEPAAKPLTELQQLKLQRDAASDISSVKNSQTTANELEMLADQLVGSPEKKIPPHPGLSRITGLMSKIPNAPESNAAKAQQKLETFKGKIKTFGRQLASQEGKLGNMAVQEWKFIADSVESIDPYAGNLNEQMRDAVRQAKSFADRMQEKYDLTYEGVNVSPRGAAKSAGAGAAESTPAVIKSLVDKYTKGK
jgi:hypothetical protein